MTENLISLTFRYCEEIKNGRTIDDVLGSVIDETNELVDEVNAKQNGDPAGIDGIIGESIDVILSALDMIWLEKPDITEEQILAIAKRKLEKWKKYYSHSPISGNH